MRASRLHIVVALPVLLAEAAVRAQPHPRSRLDAAGQCASASDIEAGEIAQTQRPPSAARIIGHTRPRSTCCGNAFRQTAGFSAPACALPTACDCRQNRRRHDHRRALRLERHATASRSASGASLPRARSSTVITLAGLRRACPSQICGVLLLGDFIDVEVECC